MNPSPSLQGALWTGNQQLATKNQLISSVAGIYADLQDISGFNFQNLEVSTLTVKNWISAPTMYVSSLYAQNIDLSGISLDASGIFIVNDLSGNLSRFNLTLLSSIVFNAPDINVSVQFNVKDAASGVLSGLGFLIFETLLGLGAGAGAAFQGIGNGIAAMIMANGSQNTYINTSNFELINGSTQLQISTLGNAYPAYSSIMKYVSSISPNQVPGQPEFLSTLFYPGQICIRSISDPFPVVSPDPNLATSSIQQFGEWIPMTGLEPEDIYANSVSTNTLIANVATIENQQSYNIYTSTLAVDNNIDLKYDAELRFFTGASTYARMLGTLQNLYIQTDDRIVYTQPFTSVENASLNIGSNANESLFIVSSIFSQGNIQANSGFFSTLSVETLTVVSTINLTSTNQEIVTSTLTLEADTAYINNAYISTMAPFKFVSQLGNPLGTFDITKVDTLFSTSYSQVSSLQQNIMSYSLNTTVQDEASFNIGPGTNSPYYTLTPNNVGQWGSTILVYDNLFYSGTIDLGWVGQWDVSGGNLPGGATFDVLVTNNSQGSTRPLTVSENSNQQAPFATSTLVQTVSANPGVIQTFRLTLPPIPRTGWWNVVTPAPAPYQSSNNNQFQIFQDINDTYITASDRLHLRAGDIFMDGTLNLNTLNIPNFQAITIQATSTLTAPVITTSSITANPNTGGIDTYYFKASTVSYNASPTTVVPLQMTFNVQSPDYLPVYTLIPPFMGSNAFTSYNYTSWNGTIWTNQTAISLGAPKIYLGDVQTTQGSYAAKFWINNDYLPTPYALPIYTIQSSGSNLLGIIPGGNYGLIQTTDGNTWTLNSNVPNPQGSAGGNFSNIVTVSQTTQQTTVNNTQNLQVNAPNTTFVTGSMNLYADQIRVNSRRYGSLESAGLPSFPIGIENTVYIDSNIAWTYNAGPGMWQSDAANIIYNINGTIFYDANSWIVQVIPSRFRTNDCPIVSWDVQPAIFAVGGGGTGYCWGYNRYIEVSADPNTGANNWNWIIAFPKNYCTYQ